MSDSTIYLQHLTSYPLVSDSISTFKSNPYGQKSLSIASTGYDQYGKPFLPYLQKPYSFVSPYVSRADALGDSTLSKVDDKFPIVKQETEKIRSTVLDFAHYPFKLAGDAKGYLFDTYGEEYKKCGGDGLVARGKAVVTTGLVFTADGLAWLSQVLATKKEQGKETAKEIGEKVNN